MVIGNQDYKEQPLRNPANDAQDMAETLKRLGFSVQLIQDADLREMETAARTFSSRLRNSDVGLFFYAGHGVQSDGVNYLVPVKADIQGATDLRYKAMDVGFVLDLMEDAGSKLNIVILDACRNNPFRGMRGGSRGLLNMSGPAGSIIAFATSPNNTAEDGDGRNGIYTKYLLQNIQKPGVSIEEMFKLVRIGVSRETHGRQTPWENSSLSREFCFAGCAVPEAEAASAETSKEMARILRENERLSREMDKMRVEQQASQSRVEELRTIQKEKETLEQQIQTLDVSRKVQQDYQGQLTKVLKEKQALEQALQDRDRDAESQKSTQDDLSRLSREKSRLEQELKRYEQASQLRDNQVEELERLKKEKNRLEQEAKRYSAIDQARNDRIKELERVRKENEVLLSTLRERDEQLKESKAALRDASRTKQFSPEKETYTPLIVNP